MGASAVPQSTVASQPALQWVRMFTVSPGFFVGHRLDEGKAVLADGAVGGNIGIADLGRARPGGSEALAMRAVADGGRHLIQRPQEIDGGGAGAAEAGYGRLQRDIGCILPQRQANAIGRGGADQRRTPYLHHLDRAGGIFEAFQTGDDEAMGKLGLVDDRDRAAILAWPDGAVMGAVDLHGRRLSTEDGGGHLR